MAYSANDHLRSIVVIFVSIIIGSSAQYFSIEPQTTETVEGSRVVMSCRVINKPTGAQLYWLIPAVTDQFIGPDYQVPTSYAGQYQITGDQLLNDYNLIINSATEEDEGAYKCVLYLPARGDETLPIEVATSNEGTLTVASISPTGAPECWAVPRRELHVGDEVRLQCASSDADLDLEWSAGSNILPSSSNASTTAPTLITATVIVDSTMDGMRFTCESLTVSNRQCDIVLTVTSPPEVVIELEGETKAGSDGKFRCIATGNPSVFAFVWRYNDDTIKYNYDRRFNMATLEENGEVLILPDLSTADDAAILECTAINDHGQGVATFPIRVSSNNTASIVAWILCAVIVLIIILLLLVFCYWRSKQHRKLEKISEGMRSSNHRPSGPIETEMNGHLNPAFTGFTPLEQEAESMGYGPDAQVGQSTPSYREYDTGEPKPIPRQNSKTKSQGDDSESDFIAKDVDEDEVTQTYTYQVNPNFEEYRNKASYDVSATVDDEEAGAAFDDVKKPLPQNDLDLEKELVGELSMFSDYDRNFEQDSEPVVVSTEL